MKATCLTSTVLFRDLPFPQLNPGLPWVPLPWCSQRKSFKTKETVLQLEAVPLVGFCVCAPDLCIDDYLWLKVICLLFILLLNEQFLFPLSCPLHPPTPPNFSFLCCCKVGEREHFEAPRGLLLLIRPVCTDCFVSVTSLLVTLYLV